MNTSLKDASDLHSQVPPDWYYSSIRTNIFQRYWHARRFSEVARLTEPVKGEVLDIGSADGIFSKVILDKTKARKLTGIDVLKSSVDWANRHWKRNPKLKFKLGNAHKLEFKNETFDAVFAMEVLEHVPEPLKVFKEIKRVLKKGGYAVFLVPTDSYLFRSIWYLWTKFSRGKIWDDTHIQTYRDNYLVKISKKAGFKVEKNKKFILGMLQAVRVRK